MAKVEDCHALTSYFIKKYKEKYGHNPNVNRFSARWGFDSVLGGMKMDEAKELISFYFTTTTSNNHGIDWFFYNYEKLIDSKRDADSDREKRARLRAETEERARRWNERIGNKRTPSD